MKSKNSKSAKSAQASLYDAKRLNEVTSVSKVLAAVIFIALPFVGFWLGFNYQNKLSDMYSACMSTTEQVMSPLIPGGTAAN